MVDIVSPAVRSRMMASIKGKDTKPELVVRSFLHRAGFRFSLHRKDLPGRPDIVLPKYRTVVFVHGCFWHRHAGCRFATTPERNAAFWRSKFRENTLRDRRNRAALLQLGWRVETLWSCELPHSRLSRLIRHLGRRRKAVDGEH
jgi:DNA mismatch endonuclease, patch repair protein